MKSICFSCFHGNLLDNDSRRDWRKDKMAILEKVPSVTTIGAAAAMIVFLIALYASMPVSGQSATRKSSNFALWNFDEVNHTCRAKGRLQDKEYCESKLMDQIVAKGKDAIPILISQLTDTQESKEPIYDYWSQMTAGDIAYFILNDLFTDSDWTTFNMPGLEALKGNCHGASETCWHDVIKKHGRKFVQDQWLAAWSTNKDRVYWDTQARCFRISPNARVK